MQKALLRQWTTSKSPKSTRKANTHHTVAGRRRSFQTLEMNQQGYAIAKGVHTFMHEPCYAWVNAYRSLWMTQRCCLTTSVGAGGEQTLLLMLNWFFNWKAGALIWEILRYSYCVGLVLLGVRSSKQSPLIPCNKSSIPRDNHCLAVCWIDLEVTALSTIGGQPMLTCWFGLLIWNPRHH